MVRRKSNFIDELARTVLKELRSRSTVYKPALPKLGTLTYLLENMYAVSLETEEAQAIRCSVALIHPWGPRECSATRRSARRRAAGLALPKLIEFEHWIPLDQHSLRKLALASDPLGAVVCAGINEDRLVIFGLIDQILHYNRFLQRQVKRTAQIPGELLCTIEGIGRVSVYRRGEFIAGIEHTVVVRRLSNPLEEGPIRKALVAPIDSYIRSRAAYLTEAFSINPKHVSAESRRLLCADWIDVICRVVNKIQDYGHGGSLIVTPEQLDHVDVRYSLNYDRLSSSFLRLCSNRVGREFAILNAVRRKLPIDYGESERTSRQLREAESELEGAISFIASLSRVDGAVLCDPYLNVLGFGAVITVESSPPQPHRARDSRGQKLSCVDSNLGTRHRSVMRFCWANPGSVGFVSSHDGELRIVTRLNDKLVMWERVDLRQFWSPRY